MPSKWEYLFFLKLCFLGVLMILGSMVYLFNMSEINIILSDKLQTGIVSFIFTAIFLGGCLALCFGCFRLIFSFRPGLALKRIAVGKYDIISCSNYAGKAILILRQVKLYGKLDQPKLYSLPTRLVFGSDQPRNIDLSDQCQLIVDYEQGQIFCQLYLIDDLLFNTITPTIPPRSREFELDYTKIGSSVTDSSNDDFIDPDPLAPDEEDESSNEEPIEADSTVSKS